MCVLTGLCPAPTGCSVGSAMQGSQRWEWSPIANFSWGFVPCWPWDSSTTPQGGSPYEAGATNHVSPLWVNRHYRPNHNSLYMFCTHRGVALSWAMVMWGVSVWELRSLGNCPNSVCMPAILGYLGLPAAVDISGHGTISIQIQYITIQKCDNLYYGAEKWIVILVAVYSSVVNTKRRLSQ